MPKARHIPNARGAVHAMALVLTGAAGMLALTGLAIRKAQVARVQLSTEVVQTRMHARSAMELALQSMSEQSHKLALWAATGGVIIDSRIISGAEISALIAVEQHDGDITAEEPQQPSGGGSGGGGLLGGLFGGVIGGALDLLTPDDEGSAGAQQPRHYLVVASESSGARQIARVELDIDFCLYPQMVIDAGAQDYWRLNEQRGAGIAQNSVERKVEGGYFGFQTAGAVTGPDDTPAPWFNAQAQAVVVQTDALQSAQGTIMCWFSIAPTNGARSMIRAIGDRTNLFQVMLVNNDRIGVANAGKSSNTSFSSGSIDLSGWRHFALVMEPSTWRLYIDGAQVASSTVGSEYLTAGVQFHIVGEFNGSVRDFSVHDSALTAQQVASLAGEPLTPTTVAVIPGSFARVTE